MNGFYGCGAVVFIGGLIAAACLLASKMFEFCLMTWFGKDAPWFIDLLCGIVLSEILLPVWLVTYVLSFIMDSLPIIQ